MGTRSGGLLERFLAVSDREGQWQMGNGAGPEFAGHILRTTTCGLSDWAGRSIMKG